MSGTVKIRKQAAELAALRADLAASQAWECRMKSALILMQQTYPYQPPCLGWEHQVAAHRAVKAALSTSAPCPHQQDACRMREWLVKAFGEDSVALTFSTSKPCTRKGEMDGTVQTQTRADAAADVGPGAGEAKEDHSDAVASSEAKKESRLVCGYEVCRYCGMPETNCDCPDAFEPAAKDDSAKPCQHAANAERLMRLANEKTTQLNRAVDAALQLRAEVEAWQETSRQQERNTQYYRGLVVSIGEVFGQAAKTCDDGSVSEDVLCDKVPELVVDMTDELERLRRLCGQAEAPVRCAARHAPPGVCEEWLELAARLREAENGFPDNYSLIRSCSVSSTLMKMAAQAEAGDTRAKDAPQP